MIPQVNQNSNQMMVNNQSAMNQMMINNQSAINQMNQYMMNISQNNLYNQNIQSTWQNMQKMQI